MTLIKCLIGPKSQRSLFEGVLIFKISSNIDVKALFLRVEWAISFRKLYQFPNSKFKWKSQYIIPNIIIQMERVKKLLPVMRNSKWRTQTIEFWHFKLILISMIQKCQCSPEVIFSDRGLLPSNNLGRLVRSDKCYFQFFVEAGTFSKQLPSEYEWVQAAADYFKIRLNMLQCH